MLGRSDKRLSTEDTIKAFEQEIARQDDIIYGVALFFECLGVVHGSQSAMVETYRKQLRNVIQKGKETTQHAARLLKKVRQDPKNTHLLETFEFSPCAGHPDPAGMTQRAQVLAATYHRIFPDRPRSEGVTPEETLRLMEEASLDASFQDGS